MHPARLFTILALLVLAIVAAPASPFAPASAEAARAPQRLLIDTVRASDHAGLRADLEAAGNKVVMDMPEVNLMVVYAKNERTATAMAADSRVAAVAPDGIRHLARPEMQAELFGKSPDGKLTRNEINIQKAKKKKKAPDAFVVPDAAFTLQGLIWGHTRVGAKKAWNHLDLGLGYEAIKVGVADTGVDYTHVEMLHKVADVVDFTQTEDPPICSYFFGLPSDEELSELYGGPADGDWNGHGSWIAGNIAGNMNWWDPTTPYPGINGIAPAVEIVALKISQNCGSAYDSEIISAFTYAATHGIDIVSISFGGFLDRSSGAQDLIYRFYERAVEYAWYQGTIIFASAGNDHTQLGAGGEVISHGILSVPPGGDDAYGQWVVPGGVPGVVMISATGRVVNGSSPSCPADSLAAGTHQWCKPASDTHQPFGVGLKNQLTYYSNYGPRVDFAAPGGARKFNLPNLDRGGTEGWPWTGSASLYDGTSDEDGFNGWQTFNMTSNWATGIPCFIFFGNPKFPEDQCYAIIQGTSMAAPHASASAALVLSNHPEVRNDPAALYALLAAGTNPITGNTTPPVSETDTSPMDLDGSECPGGYCHLGGTAISDADAYGWGLINGYRAAK